MRSRVAPFVSRAMSSSLLAEGLRAHDVTAPVTMRVWVVLNVWTHAPIRYDVRRPHVSATIPVGISNSTSPSV